MNRHHVRVTQVRRLVLALGLAAAGPAFAAGGAQVVDDAFIEAPGACHLETWATALGEGRGLASGGVGCTRTAWPGVELGVAAQRNWGEGADTLFSPGFKLNLRSDGVAVGFSGLAAWSARSGRIEAAALVVPVSLAVAEHVKVHLDAGWSFARTDPHSQAAFVGAQAEVRLARNLGLMVEAFRRSHGHAGGQLGLRWTPGGGPVDLDLIAGCRVDGVSARSATLGLTLHR